MIQRARAVYMDYAATTPVDPRVAHRMSSCLMLDGNFGNPASSSHLYGWEAEELVETARVQLAELINANPLEIVWTSGATRNLTIWRLKDSRKVRTANISLRHPTNTRPCLTHAITLKHTVIQ